MKKQGFFKYVLVALLIIFLLPYGFAQNKNLPNVVILATGGTIAGAAESGTQSGYTSGQVTIDAMVNAVIETDTNGFMQLYFVMVNSGLYSR